MTHKPVISKTFGWYQAHCPTCGWNAPKSYKTRAPAEADAEAHREIEDPDSEMSQAWCRSQFAMLAQGGVWGVPRSGLLFQRRGDELVLLKAMPHDPAMPITTEQLAEQQANDIEAITSHFAAAGITVCLI